MVFTPLHKKWYIRNTSNLFGLAGGCVVTSDVGTALSLFKEWLNSSIKLLLHCPLEVVALSHPISDGAVGTFLWRQLKVPADTSVAGWGKVCHDPCKAVQHYMIQWGVPLQGPTLIGPFLPAESVSQTKFAAYSSVSIMSASDHMSVSVMVPMESKPEEESVSHLLLSQSETFGKSP